MQRIAKFQNGDLLKDRVTDVEGIVMVVAYYTTGCIHYGIQAQKVNENGSLPDWIWLDESRFNLIRNQQIDFGNKQNKSSGPMPCGPQL